MSILQQPTTPSCTEQVVLIAAGRLRCFCIRSHVFCLIAHLSVRRQAFHQIRDSRVTILEPSQQTKTRKRRYTPPSPLHHARCVAEASCQMLLSPTSMPPSGALPAHAQRLRRLHRLSLLYEILCKSSTIYRTSISLLATIMKNAGT